MKRPFSLALALLLPACGPSKKQIEAEAKAEADRLDAIADASEAAAETARKMDEARQAREDAEDARLNALPRTPSTDLWKAEARLRRLKPGTADYDLLLQEIAQLRAKASNF